MRRSTVKGHVPTLEDIAHSRPAGEITRAGRQHAQLNGYDCGVFVCAAAFQLSQHMALGHLRQVDMRLFRQWMTLCLMETRLLM